ncbi:MAG: hypothetical protein JNK38_21895 [Acidobacteria bacterium]|nr:hypothetical protein [Acidobacteriota bacterium]
MPITRRKKVEQANPRHVWWIKSLEDLDVEIATDEELTAEEKQFLLEELDQLSDDEWEPITVVGEPVSATILKDRR